ncbi:MAG: hypothetical protein IT379_39595 [Deltaproteobacteria bacterium]|nr:hypothetical protein [Deltaproteobacteria bacterium]
MGKRRKRRRLHVVEHGTIRIRAYPVIERAVNEGLSAGWRRAHKHTDTPTVEAILEQLERDVLACLDGVVAFDPHEPAP